MKIAVLGAGAMGCLFGARLAESGHPVVLVDVRPDQVEAVNSKGLSVEEEGAERMVFLPARFPSQVEEAPELLLLFTKAFHTEEALAGARHFVGPDTWILTLQNGLGHLELIRAHVDPGRIVIGTTTIPSDLLGPGRVRTRGSGVTKILSAEGGVTDRLRAVAQALDAAGLRCQISERVLADIWEKVAFNAAMNALTAVSRLTVGELGRAPEGRELAARVVEEVVGVAAAKGIPASRESVEAVMSGAFREHLDHKPSMLQDVLAGRRTEVEFINGAVVREAKALGLAVPATETLYQLVRTVERSYLEPAAR